MKVSYIKSNGLQKYFHHQDISSFIVKKASVSPCSITTKLPGKKLIF